MNNEFNLGCCLIALAIIIGLAFLEALVVQLLWNWLAPLFWQTAPVLTYWQSFGICVLLSIVGSAFRSRVVSK